MVGNSRGSAGPKSWWGAIPYRIARIWRSRRGGDGAARPPKDGRGRLSSNTVLRKIPFRTPIVVAMPRSLLRSPVKAIVPKVTYIGMSIFGRDKGIGYGG